MGLRDNVCVSDVVKISQKVALAVGIGWSVVNHIPKQRHNLATKMVSSKWYAHDPSQQVPDTQLLSCHLCTGAACRQRDIE